MNKTIVFVIIGVIIFLLIISKTESFANSSSDKELSLIELENIKASVDKVADGEFLEAKNKIGENNLKILIDAFKSSQEKPSAERKSGFDSNIFVKNIFSDNTINFSNDFKQSIYLELFEASVLNRNLNMVPLRLLATDKIISADGMKKIGDNLLPKVKSITTIFVSYLLKYYDNSKSKEESRFDNDMISLEQINNLIKKNPNLFI